MTKTRWLLDFAYSQIGDRPIADLAAPEVLAVLRKVEAVAATKPPTACAD